MKNRDMAELLMLAAVWGSSFLLIRVAVPAFGPFALIELRVAIAAACLLPLLVVRREIGQLARHWRKLTIVGVANSAIPFLLYAWAMLSLTAGFAAVMNATAPLFAALVAAVWLKERISREAALGLAIGFAGVVVLVWPKLRGDGVTSLLAVLGCMVATLSYGFAANYTRRALAGVGSLVITAGSQLAAAVLLAPLAWWFWPAQMPDVAPWAALMVLAVLCTGVAYVMFFRLIANIGPARAIAVTFLIPMFGMIWGAVFAGERVSGNMLAGCAVILCGVALANGLVRLPGGRRT